MKALVKFFAFQNPDHLTELRLSNVTVRSSEGGINTLFREIRFNNTLLKLSLSFINLQGISTMEQLCDFLQNNDLLTDLDFSYCHLSIEQMTQIFKALEGTLSLTNLNLAFNTNEYGRFQEASQALFTSMVELFDRPHKIVHMDLSGLNLGEKVLILAPSLVRSLTL